MKFKIDENLPIEVSELLRRVGYDALTIAEQQLSGGADSEIMTVCKSETRVLVTLDTDFANIHAYPPEELPGILVLRLRKQDKMNVLGIVRRLLGALATQPIAGKLWIVEERRIRIWK